MAALVRPTAPSTSRCADEQSAGDSTPPNRTWSVCFWLNSICAAAQTETGLGGSPGLGSSLEGDEVGSSRDRRAVESKPERVALSVAASQSEP